MVALNTTFSQTKLKLKPKPDWKLLFEKLFLDYLFSNTRKIIPESCAQEAKRHNRAA